MDMRAIIFTDQRTIKVDDTKRNPEVCLLAYHPKKLLQLRLQAVAELVTDHDEVSRLFQKVSDRSIKDYTTERAPGTEIKDPSNVDYLDREENFFLPLRLKIYEIEYLKLKRPNHLRARFVLDNGEWNGQWLVP
jgi:hypothetical protein